MQSEQESRNRRAVMTSAFLVAPLLARSAQRAEDAPPVSSSRQIDRVVARVRTWVATGDQLTQSGAQIVWGSGRI